MKMTKTKQGASAFASVGKRTVRSTSSSGSGRKGQGGLVPFAGGRGTITRGGESL